MMAFLILSGQRLLNFIIYIYQSLKITDSGTDLSPERPRSTAR